MPGLDKCFSNHVFKGSIYTCHLRHFNLDLSTCMCLYWPNHKSASWFVDELSWFYRATCKKGFALLIALLIIQLRILNFGLWFLVLSNPSRCFTKAPSKILLLKTNPLKIAISFKLINFSRKCHCYIVNADVIKLLNCSF